MKFKVINERTKEIVGSELDIHGARVLKRKYNTTEKVDYFYIQEQRKIDKPHRNGEEISAVIKRLLNLKLPKEITKDKVQQLENINTNKNEYN